jgi:hypothetical protein
MGKAGMKKTKRRRMTHVQAVKAEFKRWRLSREEDALLIAFCACVGMRMRGEDMDDLFSPKRS